jgi:hypothetical protein
MADPELRLRARDETRAAFASVEGSLARLKGSVASTSAALGAIGAGVAITGLINFTKSGIDALAMLDDLAEQTSLTVETLSGLAQVARISGTSMDTVSGVAGKFAQSVAKAAGGNKEMVDAFKAMNISIRDAQGNLRSFDDLFVEFASTIANAENPTLAIGNAVKLAGRSAAQAIPYFRDLAEAGKLNVLVTTEQAAKAEQLQKDFKRLTETFEVFKLAMASFSVPWIQALLDDVNALVLAVNKLGTGPAIAEAFAWSASGGPVDRIDSLTKSLARLQEQRTNASGRGEDKRTLANIDAEIAGVQKLLDFNRQAVSQKLRTTAKPGEMDFGPPVLVRKTTGNANEDLTERKKAAADAQREIKALVEKDEASLLARREAVNDAYIEDGQRANRERLANQRETTELLKQDAESYYAYVKALEDQRVEEGQAVNKARLDKIEAESRAASDAARELGLTFTSAFEEAISGGKGASDIIMGLEQDLIKLITRLLITQPLIEAITESFSPKGGGTGGGLGSLFENISNSFSKSGAGFTGFFTKIFEDIFAGGFASGGFIPPGQWGIVGESGAEAVFGGRTGATVVSSGSTVVNLNFSGNQDRRSAMQIAAEAGRAVARASRRNG